MLKTVIVAITAASPLLFSTGEVKAQASVNAVQCPVGTCNPNGGHRAKEVKYCQPKYCKKDSLR
jgi:hypothetical protein